MKAATAGDGWDPNPLLVGPGSFRRVGAVTVSGEIRDGRGYHPAATFRCDRPEFNPPPKA